MHKLIITLKQHTPLIHFQHDQDGATLRATEVKPKLDKYLLTKLGNGIYEHGITLAKENKWLIGKGDHPALNYKMKIESIADQEYILPTVLKFSNRNFPHRDQTVKKVVSETLSKPVELMYPTPYFSNANKVKFKGTELIDEKTDISNLKISVFSKSPQEIKLLSFIPEITNLCKDHIEEFFITVNFGSRQNKGFGSYTVHAINNKVQAPPDYRKYFAYRTSNKFTSYNHIFKFIHEEYQLLKGGINHGNYEKSKLFGHFINEETIPQRWEKRKLKKLINKNRINNKRLYSKNNKMPIDISVDGEYNNFEDKQKNNYKFIRALLGLPGAYEFAIAQNHDISERDYSNNYTFKISHECDDKKNEIQRFKSPLFFKVINGYVYLRYDDSFKSILGKTFKFELSLNKGDTYKSTVITVPDSFDIKGFLQKQLFDKSSNWIINF